MRILQPSVAALQYMNNWLVNGMGMMLLLLVLVAAIDVPLQKFLHKSRLKMSHQEFKQENKETDGNPMSRAGCASASASCRKAAASRRSPRPISS
jgi:flagellar biosynthetic protein FlhB